MRSPQASATVSASSSAVDHALVDRDVGDLVLRVDVDANDVRILAQALLDAAGAALAGERPGGDRERHELMAPTTWAGRGRGKALRARWPC